MDRHEIVQQTHLAFDFIQKLYLEVSYLIKEVEGLLGDEEEKFVIGKPKGYGITTKSATGLEPGNVSQWPMRKLAVFFVPEASTQISSGKTATPLHGAKVIYLRIVLDDQDSQEPTISFGVLHNCEKRNPASEWPTKFEPLMAYLEYNDSRVFKSDQDIDLEDMRFRIRGRLLTVNLYDITNTEQISSQIVDPALKLFRGIE